MAFHLEFKKMKY